MEGKYFLREVYNDSSVRASFQFGDFKQPEKIPSDSLNNGAQIVGILPSLEGDTDALYIIFKDGTVRKIPDLTEPTLSIDIPVCLSTNMKCSANFNFFRGKDKPDYSGLIYLDESGGVPDNFKLCYFDFSAFGDRMEIRFKSPPIPTDFVDDGIPLTAKDITAISISGATVILALERFIFSFNLLTFLENTDHILNLHFLGEAQSGQLQAGTEVNPIQVRGNTVWYKVSGEDKIRFLLKYIQNVRGEVPFGDEVIHFAALSRKVFDTTDREPFLGSFLFAITNHEEAWISKLRYYALSLNVLGEVGIQDTHFFDFDSISNVAFFCIQPITGILYMVEEVLDPSGHISYQLYAMDPTLGMSYQLDPGQRLLLPSGKVEIPEGVGNELTVTFPGNPLELMKQKVRKKDSQDLYPIFEKEIQEIITPLPLHGIPEVYENNMIRMAFNNCPGGTGICISILDIDPGTVKDNLVRS